MKVALVRPPLLQSEGGFSMLGAVPPIGLAYIASAARQAGHDVTLVDAAGAALDNVKRIDSPIGPLLQSGLALDDVVGRLPQDADVVGVTHMFLHEWPIVRDLCARVHACLPRASIVLGGENATAFAPWILAQAPAVAACVLGEGDASFITLLDALQQDIPLHEVSGLACRNPHGDYVSNGLAPRLKEVDSLPRPAWDLVPLDRYFAAADTYGVERGRALPMVATRGCPYQCTFCSSPAMWTTRYVTRDPAQVVDEIEDYVRRWRVSNIDFVDLTAIVKKRWVMDFCRLLLERRLDITWQLPSGTRSEALDHDVLPLLYASGCRNVTYAPESGSKRVLASIKKQVKPERLLDSAAAAARLGIVSRVNIVLGFPGETRRDVWDSYKLLLRAAWRGVQDSAVMIFAPYPGSALFDKLVASGRLQLDEAYPYLGLARAGGHATTFNEHMSATELRWLQGIFLASFYAVAVARAPLRLLQAAFSAVSGREETQLDQFVRTRSQRLRRLFGIT